MSEENEPSEWMQQTPVTAGQAGHCGGCWWPLYDEPAPDSWFLEGDPRTGLQWVLREACAAAHGDSHCHGDGLETQRWVVATATTALLGTCPDLDPQSAVKSIGQGSRKQLDWPQLSGPIKTAGDTFFLPSHVLKRNHCVPSRYRLTQASPCRKPARNLGHPIPWGSRVFRFLSECQLSSCHQHLAQRRAWHVASPRGQLPHSVL